MPPRTPNFAAHASLDVSQGSWLLPRRSFIHQSEPGAAAVERPPARPRVARDGGAGGGDDGFSLGQGVGRTGLGGHRDGGRPAPSCGVLLHRAPPAGRSVPTEPPPRWPVAVTGPLPMEALRPGCLGPAHASTELRPPGSGAAKAPRAAPPARGQLRGGRSPPGRGEGGGGAEGRGRRTRPRVRRGREDEGVGAARGCCRTSGCAAPSPPFLLGRWRWRVACCASVRQPRHRRRLGAADDWVDIQPCRRAARGAPREARARRAAAARAIALVPGSEAAAAAGRRASSWWRPAPAPAARCSG